MLFIVPILLSLQVGIELNQSKSESNYEFFKDINEIYRFSQVNDTISDTARETRLPIIIPDDDPSAISNMPIYVPDSLMQYFDKKTYEDLKSQQGYAEVFYTVDSMPEFPGGEAALKKYIAEHIKYPPEFYEKGIEGTVYVTFIIDKSGKVIKPKIARGVIPALDKEAIRVVKSFPDWKPGRQDGLTVNVSRTLPIYFQLKN